MYELLSANIPSSFFGATLLNNPAFFAGAFGVFLSAAFLELALRVRTTKNQNAHRAHPARMDKVLRRIAAQKRAKTITRPMYQKIIGVSALTATHDLQKLEELGLFKRTVKGRGISYTFVNATRTRKRKTTQTHKEKRALKPRTT